VTRLYFLGGGHHGRWLDVPDMDYVRLPAAVGRWSSDREADDGTLRLDLYRVQRVYATVEHPCVRHAAYARLYRVAVWDQMPPDVLPPAEELTGPNGSPFVGEHRGRLDTGEAPGWWLFPPTGLFAGFRGMIG